MNKVKSIILYLAILAGLCVIPYVFIEGTNLLIVLGIVALSWTVLYLYIEKILLFQLDAREVIDTDQQEFFQYLKNQSYTSTEKTPKVYLYSGSTMSCFVFESRHNWNIVLDRKLLQNLEIAHYESFVEFLFAYKKSGKVWLSTKAIGICCILFNTINFILVNILRLRPDSNKYKVLSVTALTFLRPLWGLIESIANRKNLVKVDRKLESIYLQTIEPQDQFYEYMIGHVNDEISMKQKIISYIEGFSIMKNCEFNYER